MARITLPGPINFKSILKEMKCGDLFREGIHDLRKMRKKILSWNTKDAKIKTWILGSVEPQYILNLKPYKASKEMWEYLKQVYHQGNSARRYQLELEIAQFPKAPHPSRTIIQVFSIYRQNMMTSNTSMYLRQLFLRFRNYRQRLTETSSS